MEDAEWVLHHCRGLGGTEFLLKTPLFDAVLALHRRGAQLPCDFTTWAPPGIGCRCALFLLRPRGQTRNQDIREHAYSKAHSAPARVYRAELLAFHKALMSKVGGELNQLLLKFPQRVPLSRTWMVHDTQFVLCAFWRYYQVRIAVLDPDHAFPNMRLYEHAVVWPVGH